MRMKLRLDSHWRDTKEDDAVAEAYNNHMKEWAIHDFSSGDLAAKFKEKFATWQGRLTPGGCAVLLRAVADRIKIFCHEEPDHIKTCQEHIEAIVGEVVPHLQDQVLSSIRA